MGDCKKDRNCEKKAAGSQTTRANEPPMYEVLIHNDDITPSEYVVSVLRTFFHFAEGAAQAKAHDIRAGGPCDVGVFTSEIAEGKVALVVADAEQARVPLVCTMKRAER